MSRQLDSLLKGLAVFKEGMQTYAQNKAISNATEQVNQLAMNEELDAEERINQLDALSNNLRLKLMQSGASAAAAETAGAAIGLTPLQRETLDLKKAKVSAPKEVDQFKIFNVKKDQQKFVRDIAKDFTSQTDKLREGILAGQRAAKSIELGVKNPAAAGAVKTMLAKALQPGNLTDREQAVFEGSPQLLTQGKRLYQKLIKGEGFTKEDQRILGEYNNALLEAQINEFNTQKQNFVDANEGTLSEIGIGREALEQSLGRFEFKSPAQVANEKLVDDAIKSGKLDPSKREIYLKNMGN